MGQFEHISVNDAWNLLNQEDQGAVLLDIRDPNSFEQNHPQGALHLQENNLVQLCEALEFEQPLMVICYHGISSQSAAQYFANYGFEHVYTISGGFAAWQRAGLPLESGY